MKGKEVLSTMGSMAVAFVVIFGVGDWIAARGDYQAEVATARTLLSDRDVPEEEYDQLRNVGCGGEFSPKYFLKRASEQELDKEKVKALCTNVEKRASIKK